ncbi:hypothetical protein [Amycolatopsis taiwanensis]|uniref:SbtR family transcriptional regulator n=1 Tax=Amycolatopsis taiwanensis TaxID=342230 RepID=UPI0004ADB713|nr:hypothetical protein [Amycolatopsis taiwanensis]
MPQPTSSTRPDIAPASASSHQIRRLHDTALWRFLHRDENLADAQQRLHNLIAGLIADAARAGDLRSDTPPAELATYCLHALNAASSLPAKTAVSRLVTLVLDALRPTSAKRSARGA